jgi:hypothetical protein
MQEVIAELEARGRSVRCLGNKTDAKFRGFSLAVGRARPGVPLALSRVRRCRTA